MANDTLANETGKAKQQQTSEKSAHLGSGVEKGQLRALLYDVMQLAVYAVENGKLPEKVSMQEIYKLWHKKIDQNQLLEDDEIAKLAYYYRLLETDLAPVTAISLRATDCEGVSDCMNTEAGRYARNLWKITYGVLAAIAILTVFQYAFEFLVPSYAGEYPEGTTWFTFIYKFSLYLVPFAFGTLGACAAALRVIEQQFRQRIFDPRRVPQHKNRIVLGTLSGGVIMMFVQSGGAGSLGIELTAAALGFLAGYSSDVLFETVDRILRAFLPGEDESAKAEVQTAKATRSSVQLQSTAPTVAPPKPDEPPSAEKTTDNIIKSLKTNP